MYDYIDEDSSVSFIKQSLKEANKKIKLAKISQSKCAEDDYESRENWQKEIDNTIAEIGYLNDALASCKERKLQQKQSKLTQVSRTKDSNAFQYHRDLPDIEAEQLDASYRKFLDDVLKNFVNTISVAANENRLKIKLIFDAKEEKFTLKFQDIVYTFSGDSSLLTLLIETFSRYNITCLKSLIPQGKGATYNVSADYMDLAEMYQQETAIIKNEDINQRHAANDRISKQTIPMADNNEPLPYDIGTEEFTHAVNVRLMSALSAIASQMGSYDAISLCVRRSPIDDSLLLIGREVTQKSITDKFFVRFLKSQNINHIYWGETDAKEQLEGMIRTFWNDYREVFNLDNYQFSVETLENFINANKEKNESTHK